MSYIVLKIYSFECDIQGCDEFCEVGGEPSLRAAERVLRHMDQRPRHAGRWTTPAPGMHQCPNHSERRVTGE